jgi:hypothetical protein
MAWIALLLRCRTNQLDRDLGAPGVCMTSSAYPFLYYENTEGGHGAGADLKQAARTIALTMTYLQEKLMD